MVWSVPSIEHMPSLQFDGTSFPLWKARLLAYAKLKGVVNVFATDHDRIAALGTPVCDREAQEDVANWILLSAMDAAMYDLVAHLATPRQRWTALLQHFEPPSHTSTAVVAAKRAFYSSEYDPSTQSIAEYVNRTLSLRDAAAAVDPSITDAVAAEVLLEGVRKSHPQWVEACCRGRAGQVTLSQAVDFLSPPPVPTGHVPKATTYKRPRVATKPSPASTDEIVEHSAVKRRKVLPSSAASKAADDDVTFLAIKQALPSAGWTWVPTPDGLLYCKPHVTISTSNGGVAVSGAVGRDYFNSRRAFEAFIRSSAPWMAYVKRHRANARLTVVKSPGNDHLNGTAAATPQTLTTSDESFEAAWGAVLDQVWPNLVADGWSVGLGDRPLYLSPSLKSKAQPTPSKRIALLQAVHYYYYVSQQEDDDQRETSWLWSAVWELMERHRKGESTLRRSHVVYVTPIPGRAKAQTASDQQMERGHHMAWYSSKMDAVVAFCRRERDSPRYHNEPIPLSQPGKLRIYCAVPHCAKRKQYHHICCAHGGKVWTPETLAKHVSEGGGRYPFGLVWLVLQNTMHWTTAASDDDSRHDDDSHDDDDSHHDVMVEPTTGQRFALEADVWAYLEATPGLLQDVEGRVYSDLFGSTVSSSGIWNGGGASRRQHRQVAKITNVPVTLHDMTTALGQRGWQFVPTGKFHRLVYCAPHVTYTGALYKNFSGQVGVDYFIHADDFQAHVRNDAALMALVRQHANADSSKEHLKLRHVEGVLRRLGWTSINSTLGTEYFKVQGGDDKLALPGENGAGTARMEKIALKLLQKPSLAGRKKGGKKGIHRQNKAGTRLDKAGTVKRGGGEIVETRGGRVSKKKSPHLDDDYGAAKGVGPFRVQFANVYKELQSHGWFHRQGKFGFDYFKPEHHPENDDGPATPRVFHSEADVEAFLREHGMWGPLEAKILAEHANRPSKAPPSTALSTSLAQATEQHQVDVMMHEGHGVSDANIYDDSISDQEDDPIKVEPPPPIPTPPVDPSASPSSVIKMVDSMDDGAWRSLQSCVDNAIMGTTKGASMVVSGLPGSGKSTLLRRLAAHVQSRDQQPDAAPRPIHVVQINAMELQSTSLVLRTLARQVAQQANFSTDLDAVAALDAAFGEQPVVTTYDSLLATRVEPSSSTAAVVLMDAMALMYVARKVSLMPAGTVGMALDVCRFAVQAKQASGVRTPVSLSDVLDTFKARASSATATDAMLMPLPRTIQRGNSINATTSELTTSRRRRCEGRTMP
ncbi:hypothetical protein DYB38_005229 [Aphanomyces astaci]|uniref:Nephrocystin 3-like N-terminal domain-containing protein n=1 Tax=Aphanomyces astaci TaxID=112090 RepID=A0A397BZ33_APHAT|nr:hypothetical protein DYB38_005229 [Aphanomyces astaci]